MHPAQARRMLDHRWRQTGSQRDIGGLDGRKSFSVAVRMRERDLRKSFAQTRGLRFWNLPEGHRPNSKDKNVHDALSKIKEMAGTTLDTTIKTDVDQSTKDELSKLYHVIILN